MQDQTPRQQMNEDNKIDQYRRRLLGGTAAAVTAAAVLPGLILRSVEARHADEAVTSKNRWGLLIDTSKCADGCNDCVTACNEEHGLRDDFIVMVGGAPLNEEFGRAVGADGYCRDAAQAADMGPGVVAERRKLESTGA